MQVTETLAEVAEDTSPRQFAADGAPLCAASLPMTLKYRFTDRSTLVEHERGRYVCPRQSAEADPKTCPINDSDLKMCGVRHGPQAVETGARPDSRVSRFVSLVVWRLFQA